MKNLLIVILLSAGIICLTISCYPMFLVLGDSMYFIVSSDTDYQTFIPRKFTEVYMGQYCTIYVDDYILVTVEDAAAIAGVFDQDIFPMVTSAFAPSYDADGNGKLAIMIYEGSDGSSGKYLGGYFYAKDLYKQSYYNQFSNEMDAIYINGKPNSHTPQSKEFTKTIAHEFQHLCNFSYNVIAEHQGNPAYQTYTWIDEGLSENAIALCFGYEENSDRINYLQSDPKQMFANGKVSLTLWNSELEDYSLTYLFFAYLKKEGLVFQDLYSYDIYNTTRGLDSVLSAKLGSDFDQNVLKFFYYLQIPDKTKFPTNIFPVEDFIYPKSGITDPLINPYAFVVSSTGNFNNTNLALIYIDVDGAITDDPMTDGILCTWLNHKSWTYQSLYDWENNSLLVKQHNTYANSTIVRSMESNQKFNKAMMIDLHFAPGHISGLMP